MGRFTRLLNIRKYRSEEESREMNTSETDLEWIWNRAWILASPHFHLLVVFLSPLCFSIILLFLLLMCLQIPTLFHHSPMSALQFPSFSHSIVLSLAFLLSFGLSWQNYRIQAGQTNDSNNSPKCRRWSSLLSHCPLSLSLSFLLLPLVSSLSLFRSFSQGSY